jgi:hypothetical protein
MNHKFVTLGIAAIIAAVAVTAVGFAVPQQALAHSGHHNSGIKVDQQINQLNACNGTNVIPKQETTASSSSSSTVCLNFGDNQADISK